MIKSKTFFLKNFYLFLLITIFFVVIFVPFLAKNIDFFNEEYTEFASLILLFSLGFFTSVLYKKESRKYEKQILNLDQNRKKMEEIIENNFRYIGSLNVRMKELESVLTKIKKYPETKKEMKAILQYMANKILSIVNSEWVIIRIVDTEKINTLSEVCFFRGNNQKKIENIPNNNLLNDAPIGNLQVIRATEKNFTINTYCILPIEIDREQRIMIETIANQVDMLYIIFASVHYKEKD